MRLCRRAVGGERVLAAATARDDERDANDARRVEIEHLPVLLAVSAVLLGDGGSAVEAAEAEGDHAASSRLPTIPRAMGGGTAPPSPRIVARRDAFAGHA